MYNWSLSVTQYNIYSHLFYQTFKLYFIIKSINNLPCYTGVKLNRITKLFCNFVSETHDKYDHTESSTYVKMGQILLSIMALALEKYQGS